MEIKPQHKQKIEQAWKYCNASNEPFKAIAMYRQLQVELYGENISNYLDIIIEEAKAWRICVNFNLLTEQEGIDTFNSLVELFNKTLTEFKITAQPHQLFEIGHMQISFAKKYKEGIEKLELFKNTQELEESRILEINGFIGYAKVMLGQKEEGVKLLKEAIEQFEKINKDSSEFQGVKVDYIKYTGVLLRLAEVIGNKNEAIEIANKALDIAKLNNLNVREKGAENLLNKLNEQ